MGGFLEAGGDAAELLEAGEAALDEVALAVELAVEGVSAGALWRVGDDGGGAAAGDELAEVPGVVGAVGQHDLGRQPRDQGGCLRHVAAMTGGEVKGDRVAEPAHGQVEFGARAPAGTAKRLIRSPFLAPLAC